MQSIARDVVRGVLPSLLVSVLGYTVAGPTLNRSAWEVIGAVAVAVFFAAVLLSRRDRNLNNSRPSMEIATNIQGRIVSIKDVAVNLPNNPGDARIASHLSGEDAVTITGIHIDSSSTAQKPPEV